MIDIIEKSKCCGCEACSEVCPKHCISMERDYEGFLYPKVNTSVCIECNFCEKVCPVVVPFNNRVPLSFYAAINLDDNIRLQSSSGGVFSLLMEKTLRNGGVVFGARFDDEWNVIIDKAETLGEAKLLRGSKYVQSSANNAYKRCKEELDAGKEVLFSGTPCQISGLLHYLRKPYDNLITVDFICHGVPSPGVWSRYLSEVLEAGNQAIKDVQFRNKLKGWKKFSLLIDYDQESNTVSLLSPLNENIYLRAFLRNLILRPSCYSCPTKGGRSLSDITLADFWGIQYVKPEMDDDHGTSLLIVNTKKGADYIPFDKVKSVEVDEGALVYNTAYHTPAKAHPKRNKFFKQFPEEVNLHRLLEKSLKPSLKQQIELFLYKNIHNIKLVLQGNKQDSEPRGGGYNSLVKEWKSLTGNYSYSHISFRDKRSGWKRYYVCLILKEISY